jgi:hypothetical protein
MEGWRERERSQVVDALLGAATYTRRSGAGSGNAARFGLGVAAVRRPRSWLSRRVRVGVRSGDVRQCARSALWFGSSSGSE